jgi:hypothetical protein
MARSNQSRHRRRGFTVASALVAFALATPAGAGAAMAHGTVLLQNGHNRTIELVSADHAVRGYRYGARFRAVGFGNELSFRASGNPA